MSIFKSKAIVLKKINSIDKKQQFLTIFSYDFWKIKTVKKISTKEKELDIGNIINFEIRTKQKNDIHNISNIKIISQFNYHEYKYEIVQLYLQLISEIKDKTPEWVPIFKVFNLLECINNLDTINKHTFLLTRLKLLNILWVLKLENKDPIVSKILRFIDGSNIDKIIRLNGIDKKLEKKLDELI